MLLERYLVESGSWVPGFGSPPCGRLVRVFGFSKTDIVYVEDIDVPMESNWSPLDREMLLSEDLADFTGFGRKACLGDVMVWMNTYAMEHGLADGDLPLIGGSYPGPQIKFDQCLSYLFNPCLEEMGIKQGEPVTYSQFKGLCLKHLRVASPQ